MTAKITLVVMVDRVKMVSTATLVTAQWDLLEITVKQISTTVLITLVVTVDRVKMVSTATLVTAW